MQKKCKQGKKQFCSTTAEEKTFFVEASATLIEPVLPLTHTHTFGWLVPSPNLTFSLFSVCYLSPLLLFYFDKAGTATTTKQALIIPQVTLTTSPANNSAISLQLFLPRLRSCCSCKDATAQKEKGRKRLGRALKSVFCTFVIWCCGSAKLQLCGDCNKFVIYGVLILFAFFNGSFAHEKMLGLRR